MHKSVCFGGNGKRVVAVLCVPLYAWKEAQGHAHIHRVVSLRIPMNLNSDEFHQFLRNMGVEIENDHQRNETPEFPDAEPSVTMLQLSREYRAFYQLNLIQTIPQLRVVIPEKQGMLKFQIYLVQLSERHPLVTVFPLFSQYGGNREFERERDVAEWHLLYAIGEIMKDLFWAGVETSHFPPEITVVRLA
jgi:hypothetical protein